MFASSSSLLPQPNRAVLRWSESPSLPSREEPVDIVRTLPSETLIRSALQVNEKTRVYLIKNGYTRIGIVKSCSADCGVFLMEISITTPDVLIRAEDYPADPGVLAVDRFLSEEEEERILSNLDGGEDADSHRLVAEGSLTSQAVADLNHLLRGITRTPADTAGISWPRATTKH